MLASPCFYPNVRIWDQVYRNIRNFPIWCQNWKLTMENPVYILWQDFFISHILFDISFRILYKYVVKVSQKYIWGLVQHSSLQIRINEEITLYLLNFQVGRYIKRQWRTICINFILYSYVCVSLRESSPFKFYCKVDNLRKPNGDPFEMITLYTRQ